MILTREKGWAGRLGRFCICSGLLAVTLFLAVPAWSQEEKGAAAAGAAQAVPAAKEEGGTKKDAAEEENTKLPMLWMPDAISTYGEGVDWLFWLIFWITTGAWVIVMGLMVFFLYRYRHREGHDKAYYTHGSNKLEITWTLATVVILVFIGVIQLWGPSGWFSIKMNFPKMGGSEETFVVRVYGEQFAWYFNYPGPDGKFGDQKHSYIQKGRNSIGLLKGSPKAKTPVVTDGSDDVVSGKLVVPADKDVIIQLISLGKYNANAPLKKRYTHPVLHSFFSPHLRMKRDLVPYNPGQIWFKVKKEYEGGKYEIVCAELCGEGHSVMRADFEVLDDKGLQAALGYDWKTSVPSEFPEVEHYYKEKKDDD